MRKKLFLLIVILFFFVGACSSIKVSADFDNSVDFSRVVTLGGHI